MSARLCAQDCYGGCTDIGQGFSGMMDEVRPLYTGTNNSDPSQSSSERGSSMGGGRQVRIWNVVREQKDIVQWMRRTTGLENHKCAAFPSSISACNHFCSAPVGLQTSVSTSLEDCIL